MFLDCQQFFFSIAQSPSHHTYVQRFWNSVDQSDSVLLQSNCVGLSGNYPPMCSNVAFVWHKIQMTTFLDLFYFLENDSATLLWCYDVLKEKRRFFPVIRSTLKPIDLYQVILSQWSSDASSPSVPAMLPFACCYCTSDRSQLRWWTLWCSVYVGHLWWIAIDYICRNLCICCRNRTGVNRTIGAHWGGFEGCSPRLSFGEKITPQRF